MKSFSLLIRRMHLYLTLLCLPWFLMYGITALAFNHPNWFSAADDLYDLSSPNWEQVQTWECEVEIPEGQPIPQEVGRELLRVAKLPVKAFHVGRWGTDKVAVYISDVWTIRRLMYDLSARELTFYRHTTDLRVFLTLLHSRAGYQHKSLPHDTWAVFVDLTSIGMLLWVASGIYIWWQQKRVRQVGLLGLALGIATFAALLILL